MSPKYAIPLEYDSDNPGEDNQATFEKLSRNRLRITLQNPHRQIIVSAGQAFYGLIGQPRLNLDLGALLTSAVEG